MSSGTAGGVIIAIVVLVFLATAWVVWQVDRKRPPTPRSGPAQPLSPKAKQAVMKAIVPGAVAAFLFGLFALGHLWAGVILAAITFGYGYYLPQWFLRHSQRRGGTT